MKITEDHKSNILNRIVDYSKEDLTDKDIEILVKIFSTEPMLKALGRVYSIAQVLPLQLVSVDLGDPSAVAAASRHQGKIEGLHNSIDYLLQLVTLPQEEDEDGSTDTE